MTSSLGVTDIASYLVDSGWQQRQERWRGASIWVYDEEYEVLVPARDGMGDADLRVRQILDTLTQVENRPREEIVLDIRLPWSDTQVIRMFPDGLPSGFTTLHAGLQALTGVEGALRAAAQSVRGDVPADVERLLGRVQLGPARAGSYILPVRVPVDDALGRQVTRRLHTAVSLLSNPQPDPNGLREAEVPAELCESVSRLGNRPFEIGFRWARAIPSDLPSAVYNFAEGASTVIRAAAEQLRRLDDPATVAVSGVIQGLRDDESREDRWSIEIRGAGRRAVWVRLPDRATYEVAIAAHRAGRQVRVRGEMKTIGRRVELLAGPDGFQLLED
ncbi:hypothetical protein LWC34_02795 [Kibdelosporangium philippinense]|uniref:Uncharacterized protein n=1 Tax=Kibdelosporangium philippinense TaxID=211113 RepID=A0ABS8Z2U8_9PSEU|nr:hypothetical protein [Kibdelosporangium philippinense]MCE7001772.1 hypothetical protein [Kibdelosporangium philippinense]